MNAAIQVRSLTRGRNMKTIEFKFDKVKIEAGKRRLSDEWKIELNPKVVMLYAAPDITSLKWIRGKIRSR